MHRLGPRQRELLTRIVRHGRLAVVDIDGRSLRPLRAAGLVVAHGDWIEATSTGRRVIAALSRPPSDRSRLNERQQDLLRAILGQGQVPADAMDGRVVRPLLARGLVVLEDDVVTPTNAGRVYFDHSPVQRRRTRNPRAQAVRRAVARLEAAVPTGSEVLVGSILAGVDEVLLGLLRHARRMEDVG